MTGWFKWIVEPSFVLLGLCILPFVLALAIAQMFGIDGDRVRCERGRLTKPTKRQLSFALASTVGLYIVAGTVWLVAKIVSHWKS